MRDQILTNFLFVSGFESFDDIGGEDFVFQEDELRKEFVEISVVEFVLDMKVHFDFFMP